MANRGKSDSEQRACTACKGGWVEFKVVKEVPVRNASGSIVDYKTTTGITNARCGVCNGTGKV